MAVVHNQPHPKAHQVVKPSNAEIFKTFGMVRIEDWSDRIMQGTWMELQNRSAVAQKYVGTKNLPGTGSVPADNQVVACHTLSTGERVLLHDDWLQ